MAAVHRIHILDLVRLKFPTEMLPGGSPLCLRHGGEPVTKKQRAELLKLAKAGELDGSIEIEAVTYIQRDVPNRNFVRFKPSILAKLAKSFVGLPFLKDHAHGDFTARGGTIVSSKLVHTNDAGEKEPRIVQTIDLVTDWAIKAALDGTLDRFSIAWHADDTPICSFDGDPILSKYFGGGDCTHFPGDKVKDDDGEERIVEGIYTDAVGLETSGVSVPGVVGTSIEGIRAALSAQVDAIRKEKMSMEELKKIAVALKMDAGASMDQILAAIERGTGSLAAEKQAHAATAAELATAKVSLSESKERESVVKVDALIESALQSGKLIQKRDKEGKVEECAIQRAIRATAKLDYAAGESYVDSLPKIVPAGPALSLVGNDPSQDNVLISAEQKKLNVKMGISDEAFLRSQKKEQTRAAIAARKGE